MITPKIKRPNPQYRKVTTKVKAPVRRAEKIRNLPARDKNACSPREDVSTRICHITRMVYAKSVISVVITYCAKRKISKNRCLSKPRRPKRFRKRLRKHVILKRVTRNR